ncbi:hypothetical protein EDB83DRAFT_2320759 [Lactarius deliciosus]|nr:hypothetical protein EDB83DRAFT_2320759 [Lactarius deliciosus]
MRRQLPSVPGVLQAFPQILWAKSVHTVFAEGERRIVCSLNGSSRSMASDGVASGAGRGIRADYGLAGVVASIASGERQVHENGIKAAKGEWPDTQGAWLAHASNRPFAALLIEI